MQFNEYSDPGIEINQDFEIPNGDVYIYTYMIVGIAYVDFEHAKEASEAIVKLDNHEMEGCKLSVSISNPPARKEATTVDHSVKSLGGGSGGPLGPRGRGRSQLSFVPRAVKATNGSTAKTNNDFRSMLLSGRKN